MSVQSDTPRAALLLAHPGHELRVHGWLEHYQPLTLVLTDGSGSESSSRTASTVGVLERAGATPGPLFGRLSDAQLYAAILNGDHDLFCRLAEEIAAVLVEASITLVVGDAAEGYNSGHDACRMLLEAATELASHDAGREIQAFEFLLYGPPSICPEPLRERAIFEHLDETALERKMNAAHEYPELHAEVAMTLSVYGRDAFRIECLRPAQSHPPECPPFSLPPFYESYGEQRVAQGHYDAVLRFSEHMLPLHRALRDYVATRTSGTN
jgi:hypothetical protein